MTPFSHVEKFFCDCENPEHYYKKIIELGRALPPFPVNLQVEENLIRGCQSTVYLYSENLEGKIYFSGFSDALISAGLVALLIHAYTAQTGEFILKNKPTFLENLQIRASLSPSRSNGLANMYLRMQKDTLKYLI